jgi:LuxR family maltose regulon positive regulatory protein
MANGRIALVPTPLLEMKLHPPRLRARLVERSRLLTLLDDGQRQKLTLVQAPAGSGKTTLLTQWIAHRQAHTLTTQQQPVPVAWLSLDSGDNDPLRFWYYVLTACQVFQANKEQSALALLSNRPRSSSSSLELLLKTFLNELSSLPQSGILVLEDYHVITEPEIHASLSFVLDHLPATLHLIVLTRLDPPFPLARLRAHGDLCELRGEDLHFSKEEMTLFLQQALPGTLFPSDINRLQSRLEGWATGLRLVTLALQRRLSRSEIDDFLANFSGSQRHVLSFFVTEVLAPQPEPLQLFLLQTSVLDRFCVELCDAVTGGTESARFLKAAEDANLFVQALDGFGQWYRYHALFAEAMQHEARQRFGDAALHSWYSRASVWYEQQRLLPDAIEMALHAQQYARAANLIEQSLKPHFAYKQMNEYHTLQRWLNSLPEDVRGHYPRLCTRTALLLIFSWEGAIDCQLAHLAQIERLLQCAEQTWQAEGNQRGLGEILTLRAFLGWEQGEFTLADHFARKALGQLPSDESQWRGTCYRMMGEAEMLAGRARSASQMFREALALFHTAGNLYGAREAQFALAEGYRLQGALHQAAELYRAGSATVETDLSNKGKARLGLARLSYEWNALETAWQEAQEALDIGTYLADETLQVQASLILANIEQARGRTTDARQRLYALHTHKLAGSRRALLLQRSILAEQARLALKTGDLVTAERWSSSWALQDESLSHLHQEQEALIALRLLIAQGNEKEALHQLEGWRIKAHQQGRTHSEVEILTLMALASFALVRDGNQTSSLLKAALELAQTEGYQRLFLDEGEKMVVLLRTLLPALRKESYEPYTRKLLRTLTLHDLEQKTPLTASISAFSTPIDPLSSQEQRVFRLLVAGYSNVEIASMLIVSINTVKTQVHSIYRKLNVKSRKEVRAIMRDQNQLLSE